MYIHSHIQPRLLDFPVREVHCDAPAETEWEKLAQICSSRWDCSPPAPCPPPPPPCEVANWTGFAKKKFSFFSLRKSTEKKPKNLATYYWLQSHLYQDLMKLWSSVLKLQWLQSDPPPPKWSSKLDWISKEKISFFSLRKSTQKEI